MKTRERHFYSMSGARIPHDVNPGPHLTCAHCGALRSGSDFENGAPDAPCFACRKLTVKLAYKFFVELCVLVAMETAIAALPEHDDPDGPCMKCLNLHAEDKPELHDGCRNQLNASLWENYRWSSAEYCATKAGWTRDEVLGWILEGVVPARARH